MFYGESQPPKVVKCLSALLKNPISREEAQKAHTKNAVYALVKLGLLSVDGQPSIPKPFRHLSTEEMVRKAALNIEVVSFVYKILDHNANLSGIEIGGRVAEEFKRPWIPKSKQRNGAGLARWAAWLGAGVSEEHFRQSIRDVDQIVERLKSLRPEEYGTLSLVKRFSGKRDTLEIGRPNLISEELLDAILILKKDTDMTMTGIAARIGVSRATIQRAQNRHGSKRRASNYVPGDASAVDG